MKQEYRMSTPRTSRRTLLKGTIAGVAGVAATSGIVGGGLYLSSRLGSVHAAGGGDSGVMTNLTNGNMQGNRATTQGTVTPQGKMNAIQNILNIAITAEMLGITFYKHALAHAGNFDLSTRALLDLKAALKEEQLHQQFLAQHGARPLTRKFSFPSGKKTFVQFDAFIKTQQLLETTFVAAYLAATKEFAQLGRPDLAQIAAQIAAIEAEHRAVGRAIGGMAPANNRAFSQVLIKQVADAPKALQHAGFPNPVNNNAFMY
jgi:hypothetical protein